MPRLIIYPRDLNSGGATELRDAVTAAGVKAIKVRPDGKYSYQSGDTVLDWGNSQRPNWHTPSIAYLNHPDRVAICANKISTFKNLDSRVPIPEWTTSRATAREWIDQGHIVVVRQRVTGSGGEGIIIAKAKEEVVDAPLYTKYFLRKHEYRLHIMVGRDGNPVIIDFAQKKKRTDFEGEVNMHVRSHANGWIFAKQDVVLPAKVKQVAKQAVKQLGMDLASVDVGYNQSDDIAVVFECNSASGIEASTVEAYSAAVRAYIARQPIPVAAGSEIDAPLKLGAPSAQVPKQQAAPAQPQREKKQDVVAPPSQPHAPAPSQSSHTVAEVAAQVIKIQRATDIEVITEAGRVSVYGKIPGSFYPQRLASISIEGGNLKLKSIEA